jgi:transcriptional regulator with XRE-family HTH domain
MAARKFSPPCALRVNFALNLKRWRLEHHISQKKMAAELGFGLSTVSAWETGARFPNGFALENIASYTRITPCRLFCDRTLRCAPDQCPLLNGRV